MRWPLVFLLSGLAGNAFAYSDELSLDTAQFSGYRPMYVNVGAPDAKLQISLKARILKERELYFSYTQLMLWDLNAESHPFRDLNYNPAVFYRRRLGARGWLDFGIWEHESNGRGGAESREWERSYLLGSDTWDIDDTRRLQASFKVWFPWKTDRDNSDLAEYRGLCELSLGILNPFGNFWEGSDLLVRVYPGGPWYFDPTRGGQEVMLRLKPWTVDYLPRLMVQVFHGYGEYLLDYRDSHWRFYAGVYF